jgi:putative cell wall-binding protein
MRDARAFFALGLVATLCLSATGTAAARPSPIDPIEPFDPAVSLGDALLDTVHDWQVQDLSTPTVSGNTWSKMVEISHVYNRDKIPSKAYSDTQTLEWTGAFTNIPVARSDAGMTAVCRSTPTGGRCDITVSHANPAGSFHSKLTLRLDAPVTAPGTWASVSFRFINTATLRQLNDQQQYNNRETFSYYNPSPMRFIRRAGADRIATAIAIADSRDPARELNNVVLARSDNFPDALAAGPLVSALNAELLFTPTASLEPRVERWLTNKLAAGSTVTLVGGTGALSTDVESRLRTLGYRVDRLSGPDRFETALTIGRAVVAARSNRPVEVLFVADGRTFADAVCAGAAASYSPIRYGTGYEVRALVLTDGANLNPSVAAQINAWKPARIVALGALTTTGLDASIAVTRVSGTDATARCASSELDPFTIGVGGLTAVASSDTFPDGLAAAGHAAAIDARLFLSPASDLPPAVSAAIERRVSAVAPHRTLDNVIYGGPAALSATIETKLG